MQTITKLQTALNQASNVYTALARLHCEAEEIRSYLAQESQTDHSDAYAAIVTQCVVLANLTSDARHAMNVAAVRYMATEVEA
jgi:hypothetical protein